MLRVAGSSPSLGGVAKLSAILTNAFPLWVVTAGALALVRPGWFAWFAPWIVPGLAVIMLGMGVTLTTDDFRRVFVLPRPVALGVAAQYTIMPLMGWSVAHLLRLDTPFAVGLILVACCPGGTASNVVNYIARANVALSVVMTAVSTFAAVAMTPLLTKVLVGTMVHVDAMGLFWSTFEVVIIPVLAGVMVNHFFPRAVKAVLPVAPLVSVLMIALICACIIGQSAAAVEAAAGRLLAAVVLVHTGGFALGYASARLFRYDRIIARTVSIEVGMQNSGLGVVLARRHFADPLTAVPCAISAVMHSVIGSFLAGYWRIRDGRGGDPGVLGPAEIKRGLAAARNRV